MFQQRQLYAFIALLLGVSFLVSSSNAFAVVSRRRMQGRNVMLQAAAAPMLPNFCADCGKDSMNLQVPPGDERLRACCTSCGRIEYSNPKIVVSCVVTTTNNDDDDDSQKVLLAKRSIEPRLGTWGIPQGFMEHGETTREAVVREVMEETGVCLNVQDLTFRAVYNVPGSVQLLYEARRASSTELEQQISGSTLESSEVTLFSTDSIPYDELCFPTVKWALDHCLSPQQDGDDFIQQRTKFFDEELGVWKEYDDSDPTL